MAKSKSRLEAVLQVVSLAGMSVAALLAGAYIMHAQIPPAGLLKNIFTQTASVFRKEKTLRQSELPLSLWKEVRRQEKGVTVYDPDLALAGYTLVTNGKFSGAWLLDMNGAVVHQWVVPFRKAFPSPSHVKNPAPEEGIFWRSAWLFPNGDVIGVYEAGADTLYGYGMVKVDKDSNVIWRMAERVHHGVWVDEDGKVYALGQKYMKERFINDFIIIASPDGKELARISIWEAMGRSEYMSELYRLKMGYMHEGDVFHANSIRVIGEDLDGTTPFLRKGRIMVSSRNMSFVGLVDPAKRTMAWLDAGPWIYQSSPVFTPGGVVMFDNYGDYNLTGRSRIIVYDTQIKAITWKWEGDAMNGFYSRMRGSAQPLANGNILVTESDGGRLIEITRDKKVVWEYVNPERRTIDGAVKIAILSDGRRYLAEDLPFLMEKQATGR